MIFKPYSRPVTVLFLLALGAGCKTEEKLHDVSGRATFNGKPIPAGIIYFDPDPTKGGKGTQGYADIKDGRYATSGGGRGVRPGPYIIRITGFDGKAAGEAQLGQPLFNEYEMRKELPTPNSEFNIDVPKR